MALCTRNFLPKYGGGPDRRQAWAIDAEHRLGYCEGNILSQVNRTRKTRGTADEALRLTLDATPRRLQPCSACLISC